MIQLFKPNKSLKLLSTLLISAIIPLSASAADQKELKIGTNSWPENIAASNMWKILLEERGYDVKLIEMSLEMVYSGVANNALDIALEMWLPTTGKPYYDRYKDDFVLQEAWYHNTNIGLVVPEYMDIDSIADLPEHKAALEYRGQPTIFGIETGAAIMGVTDQVIEDYDLGMRLLDSSDAAMMAALDDAYRNDEPIVVTLWSPHWAFSRYDLKYLDDPKKIYGETEEIFWLSTQSLPETDPELVQWMNNWDLNDEQLGSLIGAVNDADDPAEGAQQWIDNNQDLVESWF